MKLIIPIALLSAIMIGTVTQKVNALYNPTFELEYLVREPKVATQNPPILFLFHGAGSNERDLFGFADRLPDKWLVVSVRAPYKVADAQYKWYNVVMIDNKIKINFQQEEESRKKLSSFIGEIISFYRADSNCVVLAGFSQGANMASALSLTAPERVKGFAIFSGRFIHELEPFIKVSPLLKSLRCFIAHGNQDQMLPISYATENQQLLQKLGIRVTFSEDTVAHSISPKHFGEFIQWLSQF